MLNVEVLEDKGKEVGRTLAMEKIVALKHERQFSHVHIIFKAKRLLPLRTWRRRCSVMCKSVSRFEQTIILTGMSYLFGFSCLLLCHFTTKHLFSRPTF